MNMKKIFILLAAFAMTMALQAQTTLELVSKNLQSSKEGSDLYMVGDAEDRSWTLQVLIEGYTDYDTYENVIGEYVDAKGITYDLTGSGTFSYDAELKSDKFVGTLQTEDGSLVLKVLMYYKDDRVAVAVNAQNATFTLTKSEILYVEGIWNDGTADHALKFELMEGLLLDSAYTEVQLNVNGGPMQGGWFAQSKDAKITRNGDLLTLTGLFERYENGTLYQVTVSGTMPNTAVDAIAVEELGTKQMLNGQLFILKDGVMYNSLGSVVE